MQDVYGCEVWTMKKEDENIQRRLERKIIRIYGPVRQGMEWRTRNNEEIDNIVRKEDVVRFVKARRIGWIGQVEKQRTV
jgi:hypothetical protein